MLIKYKRYMNITPEMAKELDAFSDAIAKIRAKCEDLYNTHAKEQSVCLQVDRTGCIVSVDKSLEYERSGIMDL